MKANKKNYMPGGGMLRNQYQQGGALSYGAGYRMSAGQAASAAKPRQKFSYMPKPKEEQPAQASRITTTQQPATAKTTSPASAPTVKPVPPVKGGDMTFGEAFAAARKQGLKEFEYKGKKYNTMLKSPTTQRSSETIRPMPSKVATEVGGKYFESPTGKTAYTPGKSTMATMPMAPMRTASSVASSASTSPQIRTTMSDAKKEDKKPMSTVARAMMNRYMSKYKK